MYIKKKQYLCTLKGKMPNRMFGIIANIDWSLAEKETGVDRERLAQELDAILQTFDFTTTTNNLYLNKSEDLVGVFRAMNALKAIPWFVQAVRDIRAFRVENWSDFTGFMKE